MFANKVVLVTGGSSGIGADAVVEFAKQGASVALVGRNETRLKEVATEMRKIWSQNPRQKADVSKETSENRHSTEVDKFGKLDVLVNNAGILRYAPVTDPNLLANYDEVMNTNLRPVIHLSSLAILT
uniref:Short-chain dehydrogenase n=1 Tax=Heliothis virescens TaxID=7102 RepID=A0A2A4IYY0_HELVI